MFKKKIFRTQQLKFMLLNLIAFTVIFTIFGIIVFDQVQRTLYSKVDEELMSYKEMHLKDGIGELHPPKNEGPFPDERPRRPNPRIIVVKWNEESQILNENQIGTLNLENYLQDYKLDKTVINEVTPTTINDLYHFRYVLLQDTNVEGPLAYTQLMINVDAEQTIINNFGRLILIYSLVFIILSISASYLLSRKMMKPIILSWNKQAEFVENASHELRTPLTVIQNKLELLLTTPHEKIANKFENIALSLSETRRLSKLTSDLLTLARADSAETQLVKHSFHFDKLIEKISAPYQEIAESQDKHFWLRLNCDIHIEADEVRLHQLIVILLDNALKYTNENDSIGIKTYIEDQKVVLEVSDTGMGIKEENIKYIFNRFYREDKARSRETGGIGLGLSIAQWIVSIHNGSIKAFKNQHKGTTFKIKLPK